MTNPDSRCLAEVEGQPGLLLLLPLPPPLPLAWWNERMHVSTSPPPTSFPWAPLVIQPLPSFIFVKLCELFLNHLSCLCAGFLRRNSTVQWANPFRVCGRRGRKDGHQGKSFKQIAKYWTCVKSCIIYEICIKSNVPSGTINTYSIFEL